MEDPERNLFALECQPFIEKTRPSYWTNMLSNKNSISLKTSSLVYLEDDLESFFYKVYEVYTKNYTFAARCTDLFGVLTMNNVFESGF